MMQERQGTIDKETFIDRIFLIKIIVKAMESIDDNPEMSLRYTYSAAKSICIDIFSREIGKPSDNQLGNMIEVLSFKDYLPQRIKRSFREILSQSNYADDLYESSKFIDRSKINICLNSLVLITNWYFHEYLNAEIPAEIVAVNNEFEPSPEKQSEASLKLKPEAIAKGMGLPFSLRQYQWEGVSFLVNSESALLADEMGLGKTIQAIIALRIILHESISKRALVVTPTSLALNWESEFSIWAPNLVVRRVIGSREDRLASYRLPIQVLIATYDQIRTDGVNMGQHIIFDAVVLDEAQRIKNRNSQVALGCRLIRREKSWALSGTPFENSLDDLSSIFLFLKPGLIDAGMPPKVVHKSIHNHFLRRRKREVLREIPPIIIQDVPMELSNAQQEAYTNIWITRKEESKKRGTPVSEATMFALITKLKQICNYDKLSGESVKWDALSAIIEDLSQPEDKIIIFSQYVKTLNFLSRKMNSFPHNLFTGNLTQEEKAHVLEVFKSEDGPRALLISLKAGGVGLNIQEASTVILFDRWWNPAVEEQAIQRAHRFGREKPLHVMRFIVIDTIEERINEILKEKKFEFDTYVENANNATVRLLARDDLRRILLLSNNDVDD